jgi:segregation and condensation protein B
MIKNKLEALLFSSGRKMNVEELGKLCNSKPSEIQSALVELKQDYDDKNSSLMFVNEGDHWKLTTREQFLPLVQRIVTETELSMTIMETLAVIAFKYPIKQSDLIKIRTNKAYDHLKELESLGYISRQKHGRTNLIKLTDKFFEYFDLPKEKLREVFKDFSSIAKIIEEKESEIKTIRDKQKMMAQSEKKEREAMEGKTLVEDPTPESNVEKLGNLEVVDEPSDNELAEDRKRIEKLKEVKISKSNSNIPHEQDSGIKLDSEMEKKVNKRVEEILHPAPDEDSANKNPDPKPEEGKDLLEYSIEDKKRIEKKDEPDP